MWFKRWLNAIRYPRQIVDSIRRGFAFSGGVHVSEETSMKVAAFYRGVTYISTQIAKLPWEVKDQKNDIIKDDISRLLNLRPNPEMGSFSFRLCMISNAIIYGNAYAEIERDMTGRAKAIWPIDSRACELYRIPDTGELVYRVIAGSNQFPGQDVFLPFNDVFHIKNLHTKDGLNGQGIVAYAIDILGISLGADRMAGNLFANGGIPSGVISLEGKLSPEAYERLKISWKEKHGGKQSGGVALLEEGAKFSPITMAPDVLQFLESRKFNVVEIARFLGVPPTKLYDTASSKYANKENENLEVATDTLDSWARNLEQEADIKILNGQYGGRRTEMDLYAIFRGDMTTRANYFSKMMQTGAITPNQIRAREGMPPYKEGNRYFIAINNFSPADRIDEIIDAQVSKSNNANASKAPPGQVDNTGGSQNALEEAATKFLEKGL